MSVTMHSSSTISLEEGDAVTSTRITERERPKKNEKNATRVPGAFSNGSSEVRRRLEEVVDGSRGSTMSPVSSKSPDSIHGRLATVLSADKSRTEDGETTTNVSGSSSWSASNSQQQQQQSSLRTRQLRNAPKTPVSVRERMKNFESVQHQLSLASFGTLDGDEDGPAAAASSNDEQTPLLSPPSERSILVTDSTCSTSPPKTPTLLRSFVESSKNVVADVRSLGGRSRYTSMSDETDSQEEEGQRQEPSGRPIKNKGRVPRKVHQDEGEEAPMVRSKSVPKSVQRGGATDGTKRRVVRVRRADLDQNVVGGEQIMVGSSSRRIVRKPRPSTQDATSFECKQAVAERPVLRTVRRHSLGYGLTAATTTAASSPDDHVRKTVKLSNVSSSKVESSVVNTNEEVNLVHRKTRVPRRHSIGNHGLTGAESAVDLGEESLSSSVGAKSPCDDHDDQVVPESKVVQADGKPSGSYGKKYANERERLEKEIQKLMARLEMESTSNTELDERAAASSTDRNERTSCEASEKEVAAHSKQRVVRKTRLVRRVARPSLTESERSKSQRELVGDEKRPAAPGRTRSRSLSPVRNRTISPEPVFAMQKQSVDDELELLRMQKAEQKLSIRRLQEGRRSDEVAQSSQQGIAERGRRVLPARSRSRSLSPVRNRALMEQVTSVPFIKQSIDEELDHLRREKAESRRNIKYKRLSIGTSRFGAVGDVAGVEKPLRPGRTRSRSLSPMRREAQQLESPRGSPELGDALDDGIPKSEEKDRLTKERRAVEDGREKSALSDTRRRLGRQRAPPGRTRSRSLSPLGSLEKSTMADKENSNGAPTKAYLHVEKLRLEREIENLKSKLRLSEETEPKEEQSHRIKARRMARSGNRTNQVSGAWEESKEVEPESPNVTTTPPPHMPLVRKAGIHVARRNLVQDSKDDSGSTGHQSLETKREALRSAPGRSRSRSLSPVRNALDEQHDTRLESTHIHRSARVRSRSLSPVRKEGAWSDDTAIASKSALTDELERLRLERAIQRLKAKLVTTENEGSDSRPKSELALERNRLKKELERKKRSGRKPRSAVASASAYEDIQGSSEVGPLLSTIDLGARNDDSCQPTEGDQTVSYGKAESDKPELLRPPAAIVGTTGDRNTTQIYQMTNTDSFVSGKGKKEPTMNAFNRKKGSDHAVSASLSVLSIESPRNVVNASPSAGSDKGSPWSVKLRRLSYEKSESPPFSRPQTPQAPKMQLTIPSSSSPQRRSLKDYMDKLQPPLERPATPESGRNSQSSSPWSNVKLRQVSRDVFMNSVERFQAPFAADAGVRLPIPPSGAKGPPSSSFKDRIRIFQAAAERASSRAKEIEAQKASLKPLRSFIHRKRSAIRIQAYVRGMLQRIAFRRIKAAVRIQAFARAVPHRLRYRVRNLEEGLVKLRQRKKNDIALIHLQKWNKMEAMRKEFEAQMTKKGVWTKSDTDAENLVKRLERENSMIQARNNKLLEMQMQLRVRQEMANQSAQNDHRNFATVQEAVAVLSEKNDTLSKKTEKLEEKIDQRSIELEILGHRVHYEKTLRTLTEKAVLAIVECVESRCDDQRLVKMVLALADGEEYVEEDEEVEIDDEDSDEEESIHDLAGFGKPASPPKRQASGFELSFRLDLDDDVSMLGDSMHDTEVFQRSTTQGSSFFNDSAKEGQSSFASSVTEVIEEEIIEEETVDGSDQDDGETLSDESSAYVENSSIIY